MRILGIDPGLATVGFSIIDVDKAKMKLVTCGIISTPAHTSLSSRLDRIFDDLNELISTFSPDVMSIEELFFNTNITTGISVAHARGVICSRLTVPECVFLSIRHCRSSRPLSDMAEPKRNRLLRW